MGNQAVRGGSGVCESASIISPRSRPRHKFYPLTTIGLAMDEIRSCWKSDTTMMSISSFELIVNDQDGVL